MQQLLGFSTEGWFFAALGVIVTLVFELVNRLRKGPSGTQLSVHQNSLVVIDSPSEEFQTDVSVRFRDQAVPRLSICRISMWNSGGTAIDARTLIEKDPIVFSIPQGTVVLDARVEKDPQDGGRGIEVLVDQANPGLVRPQFEVLNAGEGFRLRVLHTAKAEPLVMSGALRGGRIVGAMETARDMKRRSDVAGFVLLLLSFGVAFLFYRVLLGFGINPDTASFTAFMTFPFWQLLGLRKVTHWLFTRRHPIHLVELPESLGIDRK